LESISNQTDYRRGFDVLLLNTEYLQARTESVIRKLLESDVRGVAIMNSSLDKSATAELSAEGIGVVFCNLGPPERRVSNISIDYQRGIAQAMRVKKKQNAQGPLRFHWIRRMWNSIRVFGDGSPELHRKAPMPGIDLLDASKAAKTLVPIFNFRAL
jgi:hypothetical protein